MASHIASSLLATVLAGATVAGAPDARSSNRPASRSSGQTPTFRATTDFTLVRFHVVRSNHYVGGLASSDVRLLDNGVERTFDLFEGGCGAPRTVPVEVALLFDTSGSVMDASLLDWITYRDTLLRAASHASVSVYGFSGNLHRYSASTRDPERLRDALTRVLQTTAESAPGAEPIALDPPGKKPRRDEWNRLYESVLATARELSASRSTLVLLVVSDGLHTSDVRFEDVLGEIQTLGVAVFPVIVGHQRLGAFARALGPVTGGGMLSPIGRLEDKVRTFARLGQSTGGRSFDPVTIDTDVVRTMLGIVAETIRCEYIVGFVAQPVEAAAPHRHDLEVGLRRKEAGRLIGGKRTVRY